MKIVHVKLGDRSYPIYIQANVLNKTGEIFSRHQLPKKIAVITDSNVLPLYSEIVKESLVVRGYEVHVFEVPAGEESKSLTLVDFLCEQLIRARMNRTSPIVALGGGVIGDLAGFVAATFLRGVPFIQIPTTLLSQVDSSVGGKVAVNHALGKNLIGAFYQPQFVIIDPAVLRTIDIQNVWSGLGEVIKYGLIWDKRLFQKSEQNLFKIVENDLAIVESVIEHCCQIKANVVEMDEKESGIRKLLNFGHTIGHALEAATNYTFFKHGEAVLWGMLAMSWLSHQEKLLPEEEFHRIENLIQSIPLNKKIPELTVDEMISKIYFDKKNVDGNLCVILLEKIGNALVMNKIDEAKVKAAISYMLKKMMSDKIVEAE